MHSIVHLHPMPLFCVGHGRECSPCQFSGYLHFRNTIKRNRGCFSTTHTIPTPRTPNNSSIPSHTPLINPHLPLHTPQPPTQHIPLRPNAPPLSRTSMGLLAHLLLRNRSWMSICEGQRDAGTLRVCWFGMGLSSLLCWDVRLFVLLMGRRSRVAVGRRMGLGLGTTSLAPPLLFADNSLGDPHPTLLDAPSIPHTHRRGP
jgi:hypothetical protein